MSKLQVHFFLMQMFWLFFELKLIFYLNWDSGFQIFFLIFLKIDLKILTF